MIFKNEFKKKMRLLKFETAITVSVSAAKLNSILPWPMSSVRLLSYCILYPVCSFQAKLFYPAYYITIVFYVHSIHGHL